ncbi:hypothetical protein D4764_04G0010220 [Takifugu flavidus]|uniref:Retrotransposon-derived protein PEG10 n=1 Tax=Takifugu flavidus TaxID=433684 RepID=A0A5C6N5N1_9TELE|nr:hypothetical protein D4764_04G0010220 [Takifugu flavidus]
MCSVASSLNYFHPSIHPSIHPSSGTCSPPGTAPEPRVGTPERYSGDPEGCNPFLTNCSILFALQPYTFASEAARVAFTINHLTGRECLWGTAEWERGTPASSSFQAFSAELCKVFVAVSLGLDATGELMSLKQGSRPIADYAIDFPPYIKDALVSFDLPPSLDGLIELTSRLDRRIQARRRELRQGGAEYRSSARLRGSPAESASGGAKPMRGGLSSKRGRNAEPDSRLQPPARPLFHVRLLLAGGSHTLATFIDSGADVSLIDKELSIQLGMDRVPLPHSVPASALDGHLLGTVTHQTTPIHMLLSGNHHETIQFHVLKSPHLPFILGYPWLRRHNPNIDWAMDPFWGGVPPVTRSALIKLLYLYYQSNPFRPPTCPGYPPNTMTSSRCSARLRLPPCPLIGPTTVP